eukprot:7824243-Pyramimonas_sp.AAC.1
MPTSSQNRHVPGIVSNRENRRRPSEERGRLGPIVRPLSSPPEYHPFPGHQRAKPMPRTDGYGPQ